MELSNYPIDFVIIALVLLSGFFQKKYLYNVNINSAWKTLIVSAVFTIIYAVLVKFGGSYTKDMPVKWFFSYVTATSLYELLLKKYFTKLFPDDVVKMIALFAFLMPATGCNTVHKHKSTDLIQTTHSSAVLLDSGHISRSQSNYTQQQDSVLKRAVINEYKKGISIQFMDDTAAASQPVIIEHVNGRVIINPGGRKLKSLHLQSDSTNTVVDSAAISDKAATKIQRIDSAYLHTTAQADSTRIQQETDFVKNTRRFSAIAFGVVFILIVLLCWAILFIHKNTSLIKQKLDI